MDKLLLEGLIMTTYLKEEWNKPRFWQSHLENRMTEINMIQMGSLQRHRQTFHGFKSKFRTEAKISTYKGWDEYDHVNII